MQRRTQKPITIRSNRAAELLARHTSHGRSQVAVIEEALERLPYPADTEEARAQRFVADIEAIFAGVREGSGTTMAEFDASEYDEFGLPR